jgi:hypothetical protein
VHGNHDSLVPRFHERRLHGRTSRAHCNCRIQQPLVVSQTILSADASTLAAALPGAVLPPIASTTQAAALAAPFRFAQRCHKLCLDYHGKFLRQVRKRLTTLFPTRTYLKFSIYAWQCLHHIGGIALQRAGYRIAHPVPAQRFYVEPSALAARSAERRPPATSSFSSATAPSLARIAASAHGASLPCNSKHVL